MNILPAQEWDTSLWTRSNDDFFDTVEADALQAFTFYGQRILHEMAHVIECRDSQILDPAYGHPEFFVKRTSLKEFSTEALFLREAEVIAIEQVLTRFNVCTPTENPWHLSNETWTARKTDTVWSFLGWTAPGESTIYSSIWGSDFPDTPGQHRYYKKVQQVVSQHPPTAKHFYHLQTRFHRKIEIARQKLGL